MSILSSSQCLTHASPFIILLSLSQHFLFLPLATFYLSSFYCCLSSPSSSSFSFSLCSISLLALPLHPPFWKYHLTSFSLHFLTSRHLDYIPSFLSLYVPTNYLFLLRFPSLILLLYHPLLAFILSPSYSITYPLFFSFSPSSLSIYSLTFLPHHFSSLFSLPHQHQPILPPSLSLNWPSEIA